MHRPLILITSSLFSGALSQRRGQSILYEMCLTLAGCACALYTGGNASALAQAFDGLLLAGGGDVHPARYGKLPEPHATLSLDTMRDADEEALYHAFSHRGKPVLGICRGMQMLNVFLGGSLHQHIEGHNSACHSILCEGTLAALFGMESRTNSYHHQSVSLLAPPLRLGAHSADGVIEGFDHPTMPILGVQWHPERMVPGVCEDVDGVSHLSAFTWLAQHC